jgi:hypothetical protein
VIYQSLVLSFVAGLLAMMLVGCSMTVSSEKVPETYLASYPFGSETLTLNRDGSFFQQVKINAQPTATARGSWVFDPKESRIDLCGLMVVVDGFDDLKSNWKTVAPGVASFGVERHWFHVLMGSAGKYPLYETMSGRKECSTWNI